MTGFIVKRVQHVCIGGKRRWVGIPASKTPPPCKHCGADTTKGKQKRYDCVVFVGGKQRWKTFKERKEAEKHVTGTVKTVQDGTYTHTRPILMGKVFDGWQADIELKEKQKRLKPSTVMSYKSMLKKHLRPAFADYRSDRLTADAIHDWERKCATGLANGTLTPKYCNNLLATLRVILVWARGRGQRYLAHDPLLEVKPLPRTRIERRFLEPAQITALLEAATQPLDETVAYLFTYSGLRRGELFALKWSDLDEVANQLRVKRSIYHGHVTTPKTAHSERTIDLPAQIVVLLQEYRKSHPALKGDYIFRAADGAALDPDVWFQRSFVPIAVQAGLRPATAPEDDDEQLVGLHTLRHTYASLLINQGESIKYVSKQLGHASINITADLYGHLFKETSVSAMNRLSMRIPGAKASNVVDMATGTHG